jgi:hypothetical protein
MENDYIINHLKHMAERTEKDMKRYEKDGVITLARYEKGVKDGLELAIQWLELNKD